MRSSAGGDPPTKGGNLFQGPKIRAEKRPFLRFTGNVYDIVLDCVLEGWNTMQGKELLKGKIKGLIERLGDD